MRRGLTVDHAASSHRNRIFSIYQRDYEDIIRNYPDTFNTVMKYALGSPDIPLWAGRH